VRLGCARNFDSAVNAIAISYPDVGGREVWHKRSNSDSREIVEVRQPAI
jgi:hypothetical protein